jgi:hypothetical protein
MTSFVRKPEPWEGIRAWTESSRIEIGRQVENTESDLSMYVYKTCLIA